MPEASIIFLSYNQAEYVAEALVSALDQASRDYEVIVADDGSDDGTLEVINEVIRNHPKGCLAKCLPKQPNQGIVGNWNRAVEAASGKILIAQAGDDISRPDRVSLTVKRFHECDGLMAMISQVDIIDAKGLLVRKSFERRPPKRTKHYYSGGVDGLDFWQGAPVLGASGSYHITLARQFGPLKHAMSEDQAFVYRALLLGSIEFEPLALVKWRWHGLNASIGALFDETARIETLSKRARMYSARYQAALQYAADANTAYEKGMIDTTRYEKELRRIEAVKTIEKFGQLSVDPSAKFYEWAKSAVELIRHNKLSVRALGFLARNCIKRHLPLSLKLMATRPFR